MTREEIREKYMVLMKEIVERRDEPATGVVSRYISEEFAKLQQTCTHPYGDFNYEIGCWSCPDCGLRR